MKSFIDEIGHGLIETGDGNEKKKKNKHFQRFSLAIQRGNVTSVEGSFPGTQQLEDKPFMNYKYDVAK